MEPTTPPEKTLLLACSDIDRWTTSLLHKEGYSILRCRSGADTMQSLSLKEPNLLLLYGFALQDTSCLELANQVNVAFPNRRMRVMWMHDGQFNYDDENDEFFGPHWNWCGTDVSLSRYTPSAIFLPILRKLEAMNAPFGT